MTEKRVVVLQPARIGLAEERRQDWVVNAAEGTTIQDVLDPGYWAYTCDRMSPYDHIDVRLETGEWTAELLVLAVERTWARVHMLHYYELVKPETLPALPVKYDIQWKGPQRKHVVIRLSDGEPVQEGFGQKAEAVAWLQNYERVTS